MIIQNIYRGLLFVTSLIAFLATPAFPIQEVIIKDVAAFEEIVTISTSSNGLWTIITIPASEVGKPLAAAFAIQHGVPITSPIDYHGEARLTFVKGVVEIVTKDGRAWLFKLNDYIGDLPKVVVTPEGTTLFRRDPSDLSAKTLNVFGISYMRFGPEGSQMIQMSHQEFLSVLPLNVKPCTPGLCDCAGGEGSQSCSCAVGGFSCQVSCSPPYAACCQRQGPTCFCCMP